MAINPTATTGTSDYVNTTVIPAPKNTIDMAMFLRMLTTQLSNQNPLSPMDDNAFFGQVAQLGTVQGMDNLTKQGQMSQAAALMGKTVTAIRDTQDALSAQSQMVTGKVTGLVVKNGTNYLNVQESNGGIVQVQMGNIQSVSI